MLSNTPYLTFACPRVEKNETKTNIFTQKTQLRLQTFHDIGQTVVNDHKTITNTNDGSCDDVAHSKIHD